MSTRHDCRNIGICIIHRIPNSLENPLANRRCDRNKNLFLFERNKKKKIQRQLSTTLYSLSR